MSENEERQTIELPRPLVELRLLVLGDSFANGVGAGPADSFVSLWVRSLRHRLQLPVSLANVSRGGWTSREVREVASEVLLRTAPHLALIAVGVNDQKPQTRSLRNRHVRARREHVSVPEYEANLRALAWDTRARCGATPIFLIPAGTQRSALGDKYREAAIQTAAWADAPAVDLGFEVWPEELLAGDREHPNPLGHRLIADALDGIRIH